MDDYFVGTVQRTSPPTPPAAAPYPPAAAPYPAAAPAYPPSAAPYPAAPPYPPPVAPAYPGVPQQGWGPPYAAQAASSSGRSLLIGLLAAFATLVVVGVLAAIAIPVFLQQRDLSRRTTLSVPDQVMGIPRSTDAVGAASEARMQALPGPGDHVAGAYGTGTTRVLVGVARYHMGPEAQAAYLRDAEKEATSQAVQLHGVAAGRLGGSMRCGASTVAPLTLCVFVDGGSYGVVVVTGAGTDPTGTARAAREAFVHRT